MSRRGDFLHAVQTFLLRREEATDVIRDVLREAYALPEEGLPEEVAQAALDFVRHTAMPVAYPKPEWLAEIDAARGVQRVTILPVAREDTYEWWLNATGLLGDGCVPPSVMPLFRPGNARGVVVPKEDANALLDWAATVPGWDYDSQPFVLEDVA